MSDYTWLTDLLPTAPYPIAERIAGVEHTRLSLDGTWQFHPDPPASLPLPPSESGGWRPIQVPGEWIMQGFDVPADRTVRYWRTFELPADWTGRPVRLRFDAVHSVCRVWVNGREVGAYEGPFEVFEFDVSAAVQAGRNELMLEVTSLSMSDLMAHGSIYASHPLGGIARKVTLHTTPRAPLTCLFPSAMRSPAGAWELLVRGAAAAGPWEAALTPLFAEAPAASQAFVIAVPPADEVSAAAFEHVQPVPGAMAWDCEHPRLYRLTLRSTAGGETAEYACRVGFREVKVVGQELHVNGAPVKLRGVNRHEVHPLRGRAGCADLARKDVEHFRAANINFIRTSHYPPPEELLDACDELGMFVESESALCWVGDVNRKPWKTRDARDPQYRDQHLRANAANAAAHRHHPSVLFFSLANESAWSDSFAAAQALLRRLDPTRPTIFHNINEHGAADIMNHHYPELWVKTPLKELLSERNQPLLIGETTHVQVYNRSEVSVDPGVRELWQTCVQQEWENVYAPRHVLGMGIWSGIDDLFHMPDGRIVGYGAWGLLDGWRRRKPEFWHVKKTYSPVRVLQTHLPRPPAGERLRIPVASRFDFTDFAELTITWEADGTRGVLTDVDLPPRGTGELLLPLPPGGPGPMQVMLRFTDAAGEVIDEERLEILPAEDAAADASSAGQQPRAGSGSHKDAEPAIAAPSPGPEFTLTYQGRPYLMAAPDLMILPLEELRNSDCDDTAAQPMLNDCCAGRRVTAAEALDVPDGMGMRWQLAWDVAEGSIELRLHPDGRVRLDSAWRMRAAVTPRQYGLVLRLPPLFDTIAWQRTGAWSFYPADHIGRAQGEARAAGETPRHGVAPGGPWAHDETPLGTNDFRATRTNVHWAELRAGDGRAVRVYGGGRQAVRAWCERGGIALLVADFCTGGNDFFSQAYYRNERITLDVGQSLAMRCDLRLT